MNAMTASRPARIGASLATLALTVGLLCAVAALLAGPAYRAEILTLGPALQTMRWAATVALGGVAVALVAVLLLLARPVVPRARGRAALALLVNLIVAAPPLYMYWQLQHLPRIHDISTSPSNPPSFEAVLPLRKGARNGVDYPASTAAEQRTGYPDIAPLTLPLAPPVAFERAEQAARAMGWDIVATSPREAAARSHRHHAAVRLQGRRRCARDPAGQRQRGRRALAVARGWQRLRHQCQARARLLESFVGKCIVLRRRSATGAAVGADRRDHG